MDKNKKTIRRDALIKNLQSKVNNPLYYKRYDGSGEGFKNYDIRRAADFVISEVFRHVPESKTKIKKKSRKSV